MILKFGKYKGKELKDIPPSYLYWLGCQDWVDSKLRKSILKVLTLELRDTSYGDLKYEYESTFLYPYDCENF